MFILLGYDGKDLVYVKDEAKKQNERYRTHKDGKWFDNRLGDPLAISSEDVKRVTFRGHGSFKAFGGSEFESGNGYTPKQFVNMLMERKKNNDFPDTVETIDLIGCEIGFKAGNNKSWVEQVSELVAKEAKLNHIKKINTVAYHDAKKEYEGLIVYAGKNAILMKKDQYDDYMKLYSQRKAITDQIDKFNNEIFIEKQKLASNKDYQILLSCREEERKCNNNFEQTKKELAKIQSSISKAERDLTNALANYTARGENKEIKDEIAENFKNNKFEVPFMVNVKYNSAYGKSSKPPEKLKDILDEVKRLKTLNSQLNEFNQSVERLKAEAEHAKNTVSTLQQKFKVAEESISQKEAMVKKLTTDNNDISSKMAKIKSEAVDMGSQPDPRSFVDKLPCLERGDKGGDFSYNDRKYVLSKDKAISLEDNSALVELSVNDKEQNLKSNVASLYVNYQSYTSKSNDKWRKISQNSSYSDNIVAQQTKTNDSKEIKVSGKAESTVENKKEEQSVSTPSFSRRPF